MTKLPTSGIQENRNYTEQLVFPVSPLPVPAMAYLLRLPTIIAASIALLTCSFVWSQETPIAPTRTLAISQWVQPAAPDTFRARVVVPRGDGKVEIAANAVVRLSGEDEKTYRGVTDKAGNVLIRGIPAGVYTMTTRAAGLVGWQAIHIVSRDQLPTHDLPEVATISPALVTARQFELLVLPHLISSASIDEFSHDQTDLGQLVPQVVVGSDPRVTTVDAKLSGRIFEPTTRRDPQKMTPLNPDRQAHVILLAEGKEPVKIATDENGRYEFDQVEAGIYSLVAAGETGLAAISFEVVDAERPNNVSSESNSEGIRPVAQIGDCPCEAGVQLAPMEHPGDECVLCEPCVGELPGMMVGPDGGLTGPGGGFGGGGFGGGAAGGGGAGVGGIGPAATLGAAAATGSFSGVDSFPQPSAASTSTPDP